jgi:hypothetical protein
MYCGAALAPLSSTSIPAIQEPVDVVAEGRKARELLAGLSTTARSLMPVAVIEKLQVQAAAGEAAAASTRRSGLITAEITLPDEPTEPSTMPPATESAYDLPEPSPEGDPSIPDIGSVIESFDVHTVSDEELVPYESLSMDPSPGIEAAIAAAVEGKADEDFETALFNALTRGGGPFGRRESAARLILLPHPDYRGKAHWLRHRVSDATGVDLYTAAQILQRDVPSCLLMADTFEEAETAAGHLRGGGLQVLTIARTEWLDDALPEPVVSAEIGDDGGVVFVRPDGTLLTVERADLRSGYIGQIAPDVAKMAMVPETDKRWGVAIAPTGRNLNVGSGPFVVMDLLRASTRRPIRLRSDDFNFECLGEERGLSAVLNLRTLSRLLSPDPDAPMPLNDRFKRVSHVTGLPTEGGDSRGRPLTRREVEFTEYVLLSDAPNHV